MTTPGSHTAPPAQPRLSMPATELTLMDADGTNVTRLTTDGGACADNQWNPDATKIVCRPDDDGDEWKREAAQAHVRRLRVSRRSVVIRMAR